MNAKLRSWKVPGNEYTAVEKVTLRRLLSHTAGLTVHGFAGYARGRKVPTLLELLDGRPPANSPAIRVDFVPGSRYRYSGGGYSVVQQLIIDVMAEPFPQVMRELALDPLGMEHSTFEQPLPAGWRGRAATAHRSDGKPVEGDWHTYPEMAAAGLWTTPSDLARVVAEIEHPTLLDPATVAMMLTEVRSGYGLGFAVSGEKSSREFSHGGANVGYQCILIGLPEAGQGAVVMTNGDRGGRLAEEVIRAVAVEYDWPVRQPVRK